MTLAAPAPAASPPSATAWTVHGEGLGKRFQRGKETWVAALKTVNLAIRPGTLSALVGPDGAGKTTLLRLIAGLLTLDTGHLTVLGIDVTQDPQAVQDRLGYMPQKFGLYEDLTVQENLDLYADLHGVSRAERGRRYPELMAMTQLGPFTGRLAGRLSGGMKQKLGLACTLVRRPDLLLLDEPTVGVDPLSRRELWSIVRHLVGEQGLTVLMSTSYLDEAEKCDEVAVLHAGQVLAHGAPGTIADAAVGCAFVVTPGAGETARALQARLLDQGGLIDAVPEAGRVRVVRPPAADAAGAAAEASAAPADPLAGLNCTPVEPIFEDGFMIHLRRALRAAAGSETTVPEGIGVAMHWHKPPPPPGGGPVVEVHDLVRKFGEFVAVDHTNFEVHAGEIFGLLGANGAGKTTTFRMLCGLLAATSGTLRVAGVDLHTARASARQRIGYVAQKFSLYGQLSVRENLDFFASAYGLKRAEKRARIDWALTQFELGALAGLPTEKLPGGYKQRLAMAAALLHEPEILFLDEPTSGADPLARREFWRRITALSAQGVAVIVTTHFMGEAEYCDRIAIMEAGRVLATGTPMDIRRQGESPMAAGRLPTMEAAFMAIVERARKTPGPGGGT